jgi:hypothetical protein
MFTFHEQKELRHDGLEADCMHACGVGVSVSLVSIALSCAHAAGCLIYHGYI